MPTAIARTAARSRLSDRTSCEIRQERVAHRVQFGLDKQQAWKRLVAEYGSVWPFLKIVLERLQALVDELKATGCFDGVVPKRAARRDYARFSIQDLEELLSVSDSLWFNRRGAV